MTAILAHRPVTHADIPRICRFADTRETLFYFFPHARFPLTPQQFQVNIHSRFHATAILADDALIGFGNLFHHPNNGRRYLGNLIIDPTRRGRGVGRYLGQTLISLGFQDQQVDTLYLCCFNGNIRGLKLYHGLGFQPFEMEFCPKPDKTSAALIHFSLPREKCPTQVTRPVTRTTSGSSVLNARRWKRP